MRLKNFYFIFLLFAAQSVIAQQTRLAVGLSNYRLPLNKKGAVIAEPYNAKGGSNQLKIIADPQKLFTVKNNTLYLKKNKQVSQTESRFVYPVKLSIGGVILDIELVADGFLHNKVIAHRGAWKNQGASENSLSSLRKAIELGCEGSEFDVWLSEDGKPVISHDASIGGYVVENTMAEDLQRVPLKNGEFVPTLEQYLQLGKTQNRTALILEIKSSAKGKAAMLNAVDSIVRLVACTRAQGWVKYISFDYDALLHLRKLDPYADLSYLTGDKSVEEISKDRLNGIDYSFYSYDGDAGLVKKAHAAGLTVNVWTVNDAIKLRSFVDKGVDMITTDEPELLLKIIKEK
ncbi:MAG: hypothetical protein DI535_06915 [Citrobacter freundii]|nr:MAG: hypothetical protein DI535_06915 [Citrobacter freundii]